MCKTGPPNQQILLLNKQGARRREVYFNKLAMKALTKQWRLSRDQTWAAMTSSYEPPVSLNARAFKDTRVPGRKPRYEAINY